jgi:two-component system, NtrC family, nitrogen regulation sensor histidine kinase NtrY
LNLPQLNSRLPKKALLVTAGILIVLSFLTSFYFHVPPSVENEERRLEHYIHRLQKDYNDFIADSVLLRKLVQRNETLKEFKKIASKDYGIFLFVETLDGDKDLFFWNNQKSLPPTADYSLKDGEYFEALANGYYLVVKKTIRLRGMTNNVVAYAMIPIFYEYGSMSSRYLKSHFVYDADATKKITISDRKTAYPINALSSKTLFYIGHKVYSPVARLDMITATFRIMAFVLLLAYLHFMAESLTRKRGALKGVAFLVVSLVAIRLALYLLADVLAFRQFELFDPQVYGSNWLNWTLGDLLINAVFFCWIVVFTWYHMGALNRLPSFLSGKRKLVGGVIAILLLILFTFEFANVVRSLVADSKISFDVINFFSLDWQTVVGFIVLALLSLSYYYFTRILFRFIFPAFEGRTLQIYFGIALTGLLYLTLKSGNAIVLFHLPVLCWLILYTLLLSQEQFIINRFKITVAGILFWIFVFSMSLAAVILNENKAKELKSMKEIAETQADLTEPTGERALSIGLIYLDNDFLLNNFHRFQNPVQNRLIRDSIIRENSTGLANKYETNVFVFDSFTQPVNNDEPLSYAELNHIYTFQSKPTGVEGLYFHETSYDQFAYIAKREIRDTGLVGTFFIVSAPKTYSQDALSTEIFRSEQETNIERSFTYSNAIYKYDTEERKYILTSSSTKYPFQIDLTAREIPSEEYKRVVKDGYDELWYKASNTKVVVVAKKQDSLIESITLFSYLFCAFLFLVSLLQFVSLLLKAGEDRSVLTTFWQLNIRSQIHGTIIFISVLSFLIIGVATISFFFTRYNRNNVDKLSRTADIMLKEMQKRANEFYAFEDVLNMYDTVVNKNVQRLVDDVSEIHLVDINIYDLDGNLQISSAPDVYQRGILSSKMHPEAFYHLARMRQVQYVQEESMSSLQYLSIYAALRDDKGKVNGYLNIPNFLSKIEVNQEISNFLVTIINLNAFIFLIAGVIALFITNRITRSFSIIGNKMREIRLGRTNEEIVWNRNDEIGDLVQQYNKMVRQLERSAEALAKSEREGAWREMARQVAHEIKNPLTPMKLSIQYLQKAINNNQPNVKELTSNVANTLVEQIDHLSKIAADFARFANIGNRNLEVFDLHQVIEGLKDLYSSDPKVKLTWNRVEGPVMMKADRTHMNRLFTNLLTNAIESCVDGEECRIEINEELKRSNVIIRIKDNGEGIPTEMQPKIFAPNFTTKSSGTGLGLAMCKSIVEQSNGRIWFETAEGEGTSFYVQLPIMK